MSPKTIKQGQILLVRGERSFGLTARGRRMISPMDQIIQFRHPNVYFNIRLEHITGPLKGITIQFESILARKARHSPVCLCDAYAYPHAIGKGKCSE
jgi:hypothetical protein